MKTHSHSAFIVFMVAFLWLLLASANASAGSKGAPIASKGETIKIATLNNKARLCPKIDCGQGQELLRLPTNTKMKVESSSKQHLPMWNVIWYKVTYKGKHGWVSEFNTDKAPKEPRYR